MRRHSFFVGFFYCVTLFMGVPACQEASMSGGSGKKQNSADANDKTPNDVDQHGIGTPEIKDFDDTGWVGEDLREEFEELFNSPDPSDPNDPGSSDDSAKGDNPFGSGEQIFWMGCDKKEDGGSSNDYRFEGPAGLKVRISGEFCPTRPAKDKLTVLFVVDFSGSMHGNPFEGPNDPTVGDSCGRLKAAEALVSSYASDEFKGIDVDVGMVSFSNNANLKIGFTPAEKMKDKLNGGTWCGSDSSVAKTNYEAAFKEAESALLQVEGEKVVFFISDGSPTAGSGDPESSGIAAAESLRNNTKNLALNVIFLGYKNGQAKNPQGYLETVAGDKENVTLVASADQLVEAVQAIGVGKIKIKSSDVSATVDVDGKKTSINLAKFLKNPKSLNRWIYATEPFELKGEKDKVVENLLKVLATTSEGKDLKAEAVIKYKQQ